MSHPKKALLTIKVKRKYSIRLKTGQIFHPSLKLCQYCFTQMAADLVGWDALAPFVQQNQSTNALFCIKI